MAFGPWPGQEPLHMALLPLRCLLSALRLACSDFVCAGSHSHLMERRPHRGDTAFRPPNWPFLLLGLFKTVLGLLPPICHLGGGEDPPV